MSGTRSPSRTAPATERRAALLVAHGAPSAPAGPERAIRALAERVAALLPGVTVAGATLAAPGALEAALAALPGTAPLIFPVFMADGWFVREKLPQRIGRTCGGSFEMLGPLGLDPALHRLCLDYALEGARAAGLPPARTTLLLAAHGSPSDPAPREAVAAALRIIAGAAVFRQVRPGFIDEAPFLAEAAQIEGPALCLPFFAGRAGHVASDIPQALAAAGFDGLLLDSIGRHDRVAAIVATALAARAGRRAA
ncbi:CbiX/SirB N-terminal domain-containing protein [Pelagibius marinus]|uniref:CbiX/SirB N-terminal domain-containing protein n=1 Tax=Pelagibius marinus TaxID=2762760 RepID=UPI001872A401|nr:CbiX/SirB N-terminal domain-containing protein [Pelagibius marinus]